jgi:type II secretion system protein N
MRLSLPIRLPLKLPTDVPRWQRISGYVLFGLLSFILCLFITFPNRAFWGRVRTAAAEAGYYFSVDDYGAGFGGLTGYKVRIGKLVPGAEDETPVSLVLDSLTLRPTFLPPGVAFKVKALGGKVLGSVDGFSLLKLGTPPPKDTAHIPGNATVRLEIDNLDLSQGTLKAFSGMDLGGTLAGKVDLRIPISGLPGARMYELDLGQASGDIELNGKNLAVNGGTLTVPMMGEPTPMDLPKVNLGQLDGHLKFEKGLGKVEAFRSKSDELEVVAAGTFKLARKLQYSEPGVDLKLKPETALVSRLGLIGSGLSILPQDSNGFRVARWSGFLNRPRFGPGRP